MQFIRDIYTRAAAAGRPVLSFEFFTPKTPEGDRALFEKTLPALHQFRPDYYSVTYGAGGSTRDKTLNMVERIQRDCGVPAMAHLTCVGSNREELLGMLRDASARGICNLLALRGDPPAGAASFQQVEGGFRYASDLVKLIREQGGFSIGVAGFPEGHIECKEGREVDWGRLRDKIGCGADFVVTQLFFDNSLFYTFRDHMVSKLGVRVPIVPGVIPVLNAAQIKRFTALCGAHLPQSLVDSLDAAGDDEHAAMEIGIDFATRQCEDLLRNGVPGIHFYSLNKSASCSRILDNLGWKRA